MSSIINQNQKRTLLPSYLRSKAHYTRRTLLAIERQREVIVPRFVGLEVDSPPIDYNHLRIRIGLKLTSVVVKRCQIRARHLESPIKKKGRDHRSFILSQLIHLTYVFYQAEEKEKEKKLDRRERRYLVQRLPALQSCSAEGLTS